MARKAFLTVHGHFYQPPRENPWTEEIERQPGAQPYHDWNERITAECYEPNAAARVLDAQGRIRDIISNYEHMSFNFGPTLMSWIQRQAPNLYAEIIEADRRSLARTGHGNAIAQAYNHMILPLANDRDRRTQVIWGIRDFVYCFGRQPEGMWLPETAVNHATLEALQENGIRFTILEPAQARRVRPLRGGEWTDVSNGSIDPTRAYRCFLANGGSIDVFFYDGPISRAVAFEHLLHDGRAFGDRLAGAYVGSRRHAQIIHIATDGESFGHHKHHGEMALAYLFRVRANEVDLEATNYATYLAKYRPSFEVEIKDNTSWSCAHGVARWREHCGCQTGGQPGWDQHWRKPLREALDGLRDALVSIFEANGASLFKNAWEARDDYVDVAVDRTPDRIESLFSRHQLQPLRDEARMRAMKLLEIQRNAMLMYTSCGWFFSDLSGIETVQILKYAARAIELASGFLSEDLEEPFLKKLEQARSNIAAHGNGREIFNKLVKPGAVGLREIAAHYAITTLFPSVEPKTYCFDLQPVRYERTESGAHGRVRVTSRITLENRELDFAVKQDGRNVHCEIEDTCFRLKDMLPDEHQRLLKLLLEENVAGYAQVYEDLYEKSKKYLADLRDSGLEMPEVYRVAADYTLSRRFEEEIRKLVGSYDEGVHDRLLAILDEARRWGYSVKKADSGQLFEALVFSRLRNRRVKDAIFYLNLAAELKLKLDLTRTENEVMRLLRSGPDESAIASAARLNFNVDEFRG